MPLRLLEVTAPRHDLTGIPELLEDVRIVHVWPSADAPDAGLLHVLVDAQDTEALSDALVRHLGNREHFRLTSLPVAATLPAVPPPSPSPAETGGTPTVPSAPKRISREELYEAVAHASEFTAVYVVMVVLSTLVAAVGLVRGDVAIIIGAMVIAPLLGPNVALSLASTLGDVELARRSFRTLAIGMTVAGALAFVLGLVIPIDAHAPQIAARASANVADLALALAAGAAGALAFTSGVSAVVVGVMVAVALLPPLVTAGLLAGSGHWRGTAGALTLLLANITCVNLAAVATFLAQQVRPRTWWEANRARRATRLAVTTWLVMLVLLAGLILLGRISTL
jgi:uncharacterized hydrophobic protein (TIGR00341 family)